jgi:hypothetical protein
LTEILILAVLGISGYMVRIMLGSKIGRKSSEYLYKFLLPVMIFNIFMNRGVGKEDIGVAFVAITYLLLTTILLYFITRKLSYEERGAVILSGVFMNSGFLAFPILTVLYGDIKPAIIYSSINLTIQLITASVIGRGDLRTTLYNVIKTYQIYFIFLGIGANLTAIKQQLPTSLLLVLNIITSLTIYGSMFVVGASLPSPQEFKSMINKSVILVILTRLAISPAINLLLAFLLIDDPFIIKSIILISLMPPAVINTVLAHIHGFNSEEVAYVTFILTPISLAAVTILKIIGIL